MTEQISDLLENIHQSELARISSRFRGGDDLLSRAASAVVEWNRRQGELADDLGAFHAPSECYPLAFRGEEARLERELSLFGYTPKRFDVAVKARLGRINYRLHSLGL